jgi:hypothetical protein
MAELTKKDSKILEQSIEQMKNVLKIVTDNPNLHIVGITSEQYDRALGLETQTSQIYPYMTVLPADIDNDNDSYNKFILRLRGPQIKQVKGYRFVSHLVPINFGLNISYFTQDTKDLLNFIQRWKYNYRESTFVLKSKNNEFSIRIRVVLEPQLSFPQKNLDSGECYKLDARLTLHTYAGYITKHKLVDKAEIIAHIVRSGKTPKKEELDKLEETEIEMNFSIVDESEIPEEEKEKVDIDVIPEKE